MSRDVAKMPHIKLWLKAVTIILPARRGLDDNQYYSLITNSHTPHAMVADDVSESTTILVTGGAGFIGSNLCDRIIELGYTVRCLDNFMTGKRENIEHLLEHPRFTLLESDLRDYEGCEKAVKDVQIVMHQAALGSVPRSVDDPRTTNAINITGTLNLVDAAQRAGVERIVYAGSSSAYGDSPVLPKEETHRGDPLSPYAVTKYVGELYGSVFSSLYEMEFITLRYFNVFGPRQDPEGMYAAVIPKFISCMIDGDAPTIFGDGEQTRDFTHIENVVDANILAMTTSNPEAINQTFNIAAGDRTSVNHLFNCIRDLLAERDPSISEMEPKYVDERPGDIPHSTASIEKAKQLLKFNPTINVDEGLRKAIDWYWESLV
tara:strand:- start:1521 stop:2648 length:1128 start_codon:yes stop_codon:yes gene_type:complete